MSTPAVLLLADSRLPAGGHGHSGGVEMAIAGDLLSTVDELPVFLRGRMRTAGLTQAGFAAAACLLTAREDVDWALWNTEFSARTPSAAQRAASQAQGSALLRTVGQMWPADALTALTWIGRPHHPLVLGAACACGGADPTDAGTLAVHHLVAGACSAALRLLGLDPLRVAAVQASLTPLAARIVADAVHVAEMAVSTQDPSALPAAGAAMPDILAARHVSTEVTLFAS